MKAIADVDWTEPLSVGNAKVGADSKAGSDEKKLADEIGIGSSVIDSLRVSIYYLLFRVY